MKDECLICSILTAVDFVKEHFGIEMEKPEVVWPLRCAEQPVHRQTLPILQGESLNLIYA